MSNRRRHRGNFPLVRLARRYGPALRAAACFSAVFLSSLAVGLEDRGNLIWIANGLLLSYLLLAPRWLWSRYFALGFVAMFLGGIAVHPSQWPEFLALTILNIIEVAVAAFLLRRRTTQLPHLTEQRYLLRFALCAVIVAPSVAGILFAVVYSVWIKASPWLPLCNWITTDGLGTAILAPACTSLFSSRLQQTDIWKKFWLLPAALIPITVLAFCQIRFPAIFLIYPIIALILFRFGLGWASFGGLFVGAVGSWFTLHNQGPFAVIGSSLSVAPTVLLQLYIASGMFLVLVAASVLESLRATSRRLHQIVALHNLVTENSRDVIILADFDGNRNYVSASASQWGGWGREELLGMSSMSLVHPDDRSKAEHLVRDIRFGGNGGLLECRVQNKTGEYVWVEANLRPVRDPATGVSTGILNIVRDISLRKQAEEALKTANAALETLSLTDPLTHVANRRKFDQTILQEWKRAMRDKLPLSLLVLDVDWFKSFNDTYGHPSGDSCLKQIGEAVQDILYRASDLVARIGGEEFAVILPNTSPAGAVEVAELICSSVRRRRIVHNTNPFGYVTISVGCATMVPTISQRSSTLMYLADNALYTAKHGGRNRVCTTESEPIPESTLKAG